MRLIGSLQEDNDRESLVGSNAWLRDRENDTHPLRMALLEQGVILAEAFVWEWLPDQGEDFVKVLDGMRRVLSFEVPRPPDSPAILLGILDFDTFRRSIKSSALRHQIRLAVALEELLRSAKV